MAAGAAWTRPWQKWLHYDFIEVGTSDFRTLTQFVHASDMSCPLGFALRTWDPEKIVGLAVEPVVHLLNQLPNLPGVQKVNKAMGMEDGWAKLHSVRPGAEEKYPSSKAAWLARGTSRFGEPHPRVLHWLGVEGLEREEVILETDVEVWSFRTLAREYGIRGVDVFKTDCEGADCQVLRGLMQYCDQHKEAFPRILFFETNELSDESEVGATIEQLKQRGYEVLEQGYDTVMKRRSPDLVVCCPWLRTGRCLAGATCYFDHPSKRELELKGIPSCCGNRDCKYGNNHELQQSQQHWVPSGRRSLKVSNIEVSSVPSSGEAHVSLQLGDADSGWLYAECSTRSRKHWNAGKLAFSQALTLHVANDHRADGWPGTCRVALVNYDDWGEKWEARYEVQASELMRRVREHRSDYVHQFELKPLQTKQRSSGTSFAASRGCKPCLTMCIRDVTNTKARTDRVAYGKARSWW